MNYLPKKEQIKNISISKKEENLRTASHRQILLVLIKKMMQVFIKFSENSQQNIYVRASFLNKKLGLMRFPVDFVRF